MLGKLLGFLDIVSAFIVFIFMLHWIAFQPLLSAALYLILKAVAFFGDALSMVDGVVGILIVLNAIFLAAWLNYIIIAYLVIKGGYSLF